MTVAYELWMGKRYLGSTRGRGFLSFIAVLSMAGVAIGVAVLIVVLSVMNGFERELRERILNLTAHGTVSAFGAAMPDWQQVAATAQQNASVEAVAPYIEEQALILAGNRSSGALIHGILPAYERLVSDVGSQIVAGRFEDLEPGAFGIVLGSALAEALGVGAGDKVVVTIAQGIVTPAGIVPRMRRFTVFGVFAAGMYEYDRNLAYVALSDAARLYRLGDGVTGIRLRLDDLFAAPRVVREIAQSLGGGYYVDDWTRRHANFFRSIEITKSVMFVILLLVVAVAVFNIVSTLVMVVKDKRADIAILRTLGATPRSVLAIFVTHGTAIGIIGTLAGLALGMLISVNLESLIHGLELLLDTRFLDAKVYFMSDLPAQVEWPDVVRICGTAFALACLSTLYPAWRAARTQPAEALRHD
jgi:lipoprotein-releasing system permease protein